MTLGKRISAIVAKHIAAGEIAGGITCVSRRGHIEVLDAQGVSDIDSRFELQPDTIFGVMSMSKPVAAACAAQLIEEGRLGLTDPVSKYIPEFARPRLVRTLKPGSAHRPPRFPPDAVADAQLPEPQFDFAPAQRAITVHDIMSFTSGLQTIMIPNPGIPDISPSDTLATFVAKLGDAALEFQPGAQWHYSNATGYDVLGRIVEVAAGKPFATYARELLFDPLHMTDTSFGPPLHTERLLPLGMFVHTPLARRDYASGSAGVYSTASDYQRFAQMLLEGGRFAGREIMAAGAVTQMRSNQIGALPFPGVRASQYTQINPTPQPGIKYGYGVAVIDDQALSGEALPTGSFGWDGIGTRRFWVIPKLDTVVVMLMPGLGPVADPVHREIEATLVAP